MAIQWRIEYKWDETKNEANIRKHKIDFSDVPAVFKGAMLIDYADRFDYGEDRWIGMGLLYGIVVVVVFTEPGEDTLRIISARKGVATEAESFGYG